MRYLLVVLLLLSLSAAAAERDYQDPWCEAVGGVSEHVLPDRTRVDCLTEHYAVEFDYARKWAEAIGQALWYGMQTDRRGVVALIVGPNDDHHIDRVEQIIRQRCLPLDLILIPE